MFKPARIDTSRPEFRWKMYEGRHLVDMTENTTLSYEVRVASASGEVWRVGDIKDWEHGAARLGRWKNGSVPDARKLVTVDSAVFLALAVLCHARQWVASVSKVVA